MYVPDIFWRVSELNLLVMSNGTTKIENFGSTITPKGISPNADKLKKFLEKIRMPETLKQVKRLIGFIHLFGSFMPNVYHFTSFCETM